MIKPLPTWDSEATRRTFHEGTFENWILGRKVQKHTSDLRRYQTVITHTQPQVVIETGTRWGGSAQWFAEIAKVPVISIDTDAKLGWTAANTDHAHKGITYIKGSSTDPTVVERVHKMVTGLRVLISLDSDHHADHVLREISLWAQLCSVGSVMVVEDACFDFWDGDDSRRGGRQIPEAGGPLRAIQEYGFERDAGWLRLEQVEGMYGVSHSPCGWWQRR